MLRLWLRRALPARGSVHKPLEGKAFGSATTRASNSPQQGPGQSRFPLAGRRVWLLWPPGFMRREALSKAGPDQRIPPVLLGDADRLPQLVKIAAAQLQYGVADSIEKHGKPRELRTAFFGQKR